MSVEVRVPTADLPSTRSAEEPDSQDVLDTLTRFLKARINQDVDEYLAGELTRNPTWVLVLGPGETIVEDQGYTGEDPLQRAVRLQLLGGIQREDPESYSDEVFCRVEATVYGPTRDAVSALDRRLHYLLTRSSRIVIDFVSASGALRIVRGEIHSIVSEGGRDSFDPVDAANPRPQRIHRYYVRLYEFYEEVV